MSHFSGYAIVKDTVKPAVVLKQSPGNLYVEYKKVDNCGHNILVRETIACHLFHTSRYKADRMLIQVLQARIKRRVLTARDTSYLKEVEEMRNKIYNIKHGFDEIGGHNFVLKDTINNRYKGGFLNER